MKIYLPNNSNQKIGGGWTFLRNFKKALKNKVEFVDNFKDCDIFLITSVTITDPGEVDRAKALGKKIIFRVDNIPKKSRNRRCRVRTRIVEFTKFADLVVYQSQWARRYCMPLTGEGIVILNGVDKDIFYPAEKKPNHPIYLFAYHGKSELKQFWVAHYIYQMEFRKNKDSEFWFIYDFGRDYEELENADFDFWHGENYTYLDKIVTPEKMVELMRKCTHLIYPSIADAAPNLVLEARACGLEVIGYPNEFYSGTAELIDKLEDISIERMGEEYLKEFNKLL